jgi:alpha-glucosidase
MQWDRSPNAGFCPEEISPWLPVSDDYQNNNVEVQDGLPDSMLNLYRAITTLRISEPALSVGSFEFVELEEENLLIYTRSHPASDDFLVVLNFSNLSHDLGLSETASTGVIEVSSSMHQKGLVNLGRLHLGPDEGLIIRL